MDAKRWRLFRPLCENICTHLAKRRDHAVHRTSRKRRITDEAALKCLSGKQPSEKSHGRAGISAIDFLFRRCKDALFPMDDQPVRLGLFDLNTQSAHGIDCMYAIFAREKTAQRAYTIRQGRNDYRAMRNAFVARYGNFDINSRRPFDS